MAEDKKKALRRIERETDPRKEFYPLQDNVLFADIMDYLTSKGRVPSVTRASLPWDTYGQYHRWDKERNKPDNRIELSHKAGPSTLLHELAHGADDTLERQYWDRPMGGIPKMYPKEDTQFTRGYEKLRGGVVNAKAPYKGGLRQYYYPRSDLASMLDDKWYQRHKDYRSSERELTGWGAGATEDPNESYSADKAPLHLNPTMATELAILIDLARREKKK